MLEIEACRSPNFPRKRTEMGEMVDMILEGTLCEICTVYLGVLPNLDMEMGFPRLCKCCARDELQVPGTRIRETMFLDDNEEMTYQRVAGVPDDEKIDNEVTSIPW